MTGRKKAARRGGFQGGGRGGRNGAAGNTSFVPFAGTSTPRGGHKGFTLAEEARNTERHHSWDTDQRLRHSQIKFVSAGKLESMDPKDAESAMAEMTLDSPPREEDNVIVVEEEEETYVREEAVLGRTEDLERPSSSGNDQDVPSFIVDTMGTQPVHTGFAPPRLRSTSPPRAASPTPSDFSAEVIVFTGRNPGKNAASREPKAVRSEQKASIITVIEDNPYKQPSETIDAQIKDVESKIQERQELLGEAIHHGSTSTKRKGKAPIQRQIVSTKLSKSKNKTLRKNKKSSDDDDDDDAWIADYIANMDKDDDLAFEKYNQRELGGSDDGIWQETETSSGEIQPKDKIEWSREDIDDFDDLSTSDGERGDVQAILSKRERISGVQYLVVWQGHEIDEARWVPVTTLISKTAVSHIETFEAEERLVAEFEDNAEDDTSDSEELDIHGSTDEVEEPLTNIPPMSDAKIARLLAKQEELGMGSDEILLFDDEEDDDDDEEEVPSRFALEPSRKQSNARGSKRPRGEYPSATMMADAFDGFDVMDFDRPSLKRKPKGRRGKLTLDLSDSELEAAMAMAWENDRYNKSTKKKEREELRSQGLLGSKNGKPDLKQKYKEGMGIHAVKEEIKTFLMGSNTSLSLPPMDKADRKVVHELANAFNLKSKSAGNGTKRFPILYRTARTTRFVERQFDAAEARISRKYLPRMDGGGKGKSSARGGGGFNAGVSYRDGDVVGGSAPELAADNKGRAMLEKMGWSTGTALGALNNKGILQPVSHVVKTTKAGLG